jgi:hypothetical protein
MKPSLKARSIPIVVDKASKDGFIMNVYELSFLWKIIENKPMSLYALSREEFYFPESRGESTIPEGNLDAYSSGIGKPRKPHKYLYPFIQKVVNRLVSKGLVETSIESSGVRNKRIVSPTFKGIVYFLQNERTWKEKLDKLMDYHNVLVPFSIEALGSLFKHIDGSQFWNTFDKTIYEFRGLRKAKFSIKHLKMNFEGYLESPTMVFIKKTQLIDSDFKRDARIFDYLIKPEAKEYRNAYIAYLALHDIEILNVAAIQDLKKLSPVLFAENELALFEKREPRSNFIFNGERLKEFFSKGKNLVLIERDKKKVLVLSLQSFFWGMFVRNLLWKEEKPDISDVDANNVEKIRDYTVEEID